RARHRAGGPRDRQASRHGHRRAHHARRGAAVTVLTDLAADRHVSVSRTPAIDPEGFDLAELAAVHGSPYFLYDLDVVEARAQLLRAGMPEAVDIAFAVKSNPSIAVLARMASLGIGADVASGGELVTATRAGIPASRIV